MRLQCQSLLLAHVLCLFCLGCAIDGADEGPASYAWEAQASALHEITFPETQGLLTNSRQRFSLYLFAGDVSSYSIHWRVSAGHIVGPADQQEVVWQTPAAGPAWIGVELRQDGESWVCCRPVSFTDEQLDIHLFAGEYQTEGWVRVDYLLDAPSPWSVELSWGCSAGEISTVEDPDYARWNVSEPGPQRIWCRAFNGHVSRADTVTVAVPDLPHPPELVLELEAQDYWTMEGLQMVCAWTETTSDLPIALSWGCGVGMLALSSDATVASWHVLEIGPQRIWCRADNGHVASVDTLMVDIPNCPPRFMDAAIVTNPVRCGQPFVVVADARDLNGDSLSLAVESEEFQLLGISGAWTLSLQTLHQVAGTFPLTLRVSDGQGGEEMVLPVQVQCP